MDLRIVSRVSLLFALALTCACASTNKTLSDESNFKAGETALASKNYEEAINHFKKVKESFRSAELTTEAELKIADAYFANKQYIEAASEYETFRKLHPSHQKAPYALYRLGLCHYEEITGIDTDQTPVRNAALTFESFLSLYPDSEYVPEVRLKLADCRKKELEYEVYVGSFYLRTGKYDSAVKRLSEALGKFPEQPHDEVLFKLGKAYLGAGDKAKAKEAFDRLAAEYPKSPLLTDARKESTK